MRCVLAMLELMALLPGGDGRVAIAVCAGVNVFLWQVGVHVILRLLAIVVVVIITSELLHTALKPVLPATLLSVILLPMVWIHVSSQVNCPALPHEGI